MTHPTLTHQTLCIVGASARAATEAAVRSGFRVVAADLFADRDLGQLAKSIRIDSYPHGFLDAIHKLRAHDEQVAVVYTGALENHLDVLEGIARTTTLYGNSANVVAHVRDPALLREALIGLGFRVPEVCFESPKSEGSTEKWLSKPFHSAGGQRVSFVSDDEENDREVYYQEFIEGSVCSAAYLFGQDPEPTCQLVGVTEMLVGCEWLGSDGFRYCGSITRNPIENERTQWIEIGHALAQRFQLRGLCGVDAVLDGTHVVPIEVNPRFTASMELLDSNEVQLMRQHVESFEPQTKRSVTRSKPKNAKQTSSHCHGKCIVFAKEDVEFPEVWRYLQPDGVRFADIPQPQLISSGWPILTMVGQADCRETLLAKFRVTSERLYDQLRQVE